MIEINETLYVVPMHSINPVELMQQLNDMMMDKFVFIGAIALVCGAWHMCKSSHKDDIQTDFISGFIDMAAFASGIAAFAFYAIYRGWI